MKKESKLRKISTDLNFGQDYIDPFDLENENLWVKLEHLGRYLFVADYLRPFKPNCVADIACGVGYGLPELEQIASRVIGIDFNAEILECAAQQCNSSQTQLLKHDLDASDGFSGLRPSSLDAIASFETLEHLVDPARALSKFAHLLKQGGFLICSVPNVLYEPRDQAGLPTNPYHKQLFSYKSLCNLLEKNKFRVNYRVGQAWSNILFKRESQLLKHRAIRQRIGDYSSLHSPEIVRHLSYLLAYPTVEDIDGSYSLIIVGQKVR
ncbi:class I SAM-dependent methyltransferase [Coleofasciculus sp.]|uniref:class I SAM-dependent methyltransferase n=1 Tax=Coleofasciculus sp. TaxID=3100458 RepID=UPI003A36B3D4